MPKSLKSELESALTPTSQLAFAVAFCALGMAFIGAMINQWVTGWPAIAGMVAVALCYLTIGLFNVTSTPPADHESEPSQSINQ